MSAQIPLAVVGGRLATDLIDLTDDLAALDSSGFWAVVLPFEGAPICARFGHVRPARPWPGPPWKGVEPDAWTSSLSEASEVRSSCTWPAVAISCSPENTATAALAAGRSTTTSSRAGAFTTAPSDKARTRRDS